MEEALEADSEQRALGRALNEAIPMMLAGYPISNAGEAFVTDVADRLLAIEKGKRRSRGKSEAGYRAAISAIVIDLLKAATNRHAGSDSAPDAEPLNWAFHGMRHEQFKDADHGITMQHFAQAVTALESAGFLQRSKHVRFKNIFGHYDGKAARYRATDDLLALAASHGISVTPYTVGTHFKYALPKVVVELRGPTAWSIHDAGYTRIRGSKIPVSGAEYDHHTAKVLAINEYLSTKAIEGGRHYAFKRVFNDGDPSNIDFRMGGRLYSIGPDNYQQDSKEQRSKITIDDERTREIDIKACFLTIAYGLYRDLFTMPGDTDLYSVASYDREVGKTWFKVAIGSGTIPEKWSKEVVKAFRDDTGGDDLRKYNAAEVGRKMMAKHPVIRHCLEIAGINSKGLMRVESEIMVDTITRLNREFNIPALPVHDSLIVKETDVATAVGVLKARFYGWLRIMPRLSLSEGARLGFDLDSIEPLWPNRVPVEGYK